MFHEILLKGTISVHAMLPNTNLQYCIIIIQYCGLYVLFFVKTVWIVQMGDWPIEGGGVQNSCLALVVMYEFDLLYCCNSETSLNTF